MNHKVDSTVCEIPQFMRDNKPFETNDNPDFFLVGTDIYAPVHEHNKIKFFTTGEDYFDEVGRAIDNAKNTVFITGWQINYDINLRKVNTSKTETLLKRRNELQSRLEAALADRQRKIEQNLPDQGYIAGIQAWRQSNSIKDYEDEIKKYDQKIPATRAEQTLWHCLRKAVQRGIKVYVLPWSCPPVGPVSTFDIECMCAVYQLNVGLPEQRAFFMFSANKSDMIAQGSASSAGELLKNAGNFFFSHHQKSVIIDNEIGFVGGIDLAYGRRDNAEFRLTCGNKVGGDRYNPCIPHIQPAYNSEYVNRIALLLSTMFDISAPAKQYQSFMGWVDVIRRINYWFTSPFSWKIAYAFRNFKGYLNDKLENIREWALETFFDPLLGWVINLGIDLTLVYIGILIKQHGPYLQELGAIIGPEYAEKINRAIATAERTARQVNSSWNPFGGNRVSLTIDEYLDILPAIREWYIKTPEGQLFSSLMDQDITFMMPDENAVQNSSFLEVLVAQLMAALQTSASNLPEPYHFLDKQPQPLLPRTGKVLDANIQPRMPWHDVQLKAEGPAVYDLSRNFIDRWNAGQMFVDRASSAVLTDYPYQFKALLIFVRAIFEMTEKLTYSLSLLPYIGNYIEKTTNQVAQGIDSFGKNFYQARPKAHYINQLNLLPKPPQIAPKKGQDSVQIIRSAPKNFLKYEQQARQNSGIYLDSYLTRQFDPNKPLPPASTEQQPTATNDQPASDDPISTGIARGVTELTELTLQALGNIPGIDPPKQVANQSQEQTTAKTIGNVDALQADCQKAWIKAINGAQHFIYIESQFFQSDFGHPFGYRFAGTVPDFSNNGSYTGSGPMSTASHFDPELLPYLEYCGLAQFLDDLQLSHIDLIKLKQIVFAFLGREPDPITKKTELRPRTLLKFKEQISTVWKNRFTGKITQLVFKDYEQPTQPQKNQVMQAIAERIKQAIMLDHNFHTYLVIPVHPEGMLNDPTVMHTVHMAMQTIYGGTNSLIKQIQRAMCAHRLMTEQPGLCYNDALTKAEQPTGANGDPLYMQEKWQRYLTLLNLRTWEEIGTWRGSRNTTEQIYVHSKLMIVDDRVAILGSCNVNDRSMQGDRDTELAAIVHGNAEKIITIDGQTPYPVSETVHDFRVKLWRKLFALDIKHPFVQPATGLAGVLTSPAAPKTVEVIQDRARKNMENYSVVFHYIPQSNSPVQARVKAQQDKGRYPKPTENYYPLGCSIWPLWAYHNPDDQSAGGELTNSYDTAKNEYDKQMPFEEGFWLDARERKYPKPEAIEGFITELPIYWTMGENNISANATTIIAYIKALEETATMTASHQPPQPPNRQV